MVTSSYGQAQLYKSRLPVVVGFLHRSRETHKRRCGKLKAHAEQLSCACQQLNESRRQAIKQVAALSERVRQLLAEIKSWESQPVRLPRDPPLATHGYGAKLVSLCINLVQKIGLRATPQVLRLVWDWLGITAKIPHWTTIRTWLQRVGIAALEEPLEPANDWVWLADHSNQIGPEKALVVLAVRASQMPEVGTPLRHADVRLLTVQPGTTWKREDMARAYAGLAERFGAPRAVVVDGAVELREGAEVLKTARADTLVLGDFKHRAANILKSLVGQSERFTRFSALVGQTRCAIQQTELAHLVPPSPKPKSRFMNLAATLRWAALILWLLNRPQATARRGISDERFEEKLGWLREYAPEVSVWNECQKVVSLSVTWMNEQGLARGATAALRAQLEGQATHPTSRQVAERLLAFTQESENQLRAGDRLPLSTEILESSFGLYKQLERQHSKGGFTSLLAAFGSLLKPTTPATIRRDFARVSVKAMRQWVANHLGSTPTAKRMTAYQEFAKSSEPLQSPAQ